MDRRDQCDHCPPALPADGLTDTGPETLRRIGGMRAFNAWMMELVRPHLRGNVLEVGCGRGNLTELLLAEPIGSLTCVDINPGHVEHVLQRWSGVPGFCALCADIQDRGLVHKLQPRPDTIVCLNVLEHIEDDMAALDVMAHLLAPEGRLVLLVPAFPWLYGTMDAGLRHYRRYTRADLTEKLSAAGLRVACWRYFGLLGMLGWFVNGRILRRPILPEGQLRLYDRLVPLFRWVERLSGPPIGQSLICVAIRALES